MHFAEKLHLLLDKSRKVYFWLCFSMKCLTKKNKNPEWICISISICICVSMHFTLSLCLMGAKSLASSLESPPQDVCFGLSSSPFLLDAVVEMKGCTCRDSVIKCQTLVAPRCESDPVG